MAWRVGRTGRAWLRGGKKKEKEKEKERRKKKRIIFAEND